MRKIQSKKDIEAKKKKNAAYLGLSLILLMILSTMGYSIVNNNQTSREISVEIEGLKFINVNDGWTLRVQNREFYFSSLPNETAKTEENISLEDYIGKTLYFVNYNFAYEKLLFNIGSFVERYQEACLEGLNCSNTDLPTKTCEDNVIIFDETSDGLRKEKNCVYIGKNIDENIDVLSYKILFG